MIVSRTPYRVSFFGGGTDYPAYYLEYGGKVLAAAINKYCYLSVRRLPPFFHHKHRIVYSRAELVSSIEEIQHPSVRETMRYRGIDYGISVHHDGDMPAHSGMGSSSAFTVGLLNSLHALENQMISKRDLARNAIHIEQNMIRENVGSQDQTLSAHGGLNLVEFMPNGEIVVNPVIMRPEILQDFESRLLLVFTGHSRNASEIASEQLLVLPGKLRAMEQMKDLVDRAFELLTTDKPDLDAFGLLLNETWEIKRGLSARITTPEVDAIYQTALRNGALGGKLLGAGGGGCMLFYVGREDRARLIQALHGYLVIPFQFDFDGSRIIVYDPNYPGAA
ncbi:MAG: GHMP family kinase ATP-binding protein [Candidatus Methylomirabilia bacterium]